MRPPILILLAFFVGSAAEAWAVDLAPGERIVFESRREGAQIDLYAVGAGGLQIRNLTRTPSLDEYNVRASRDGRMIAFNRGRAGASGEGDDIFVMRNDGTAVRRVSQTENVTEFRPTFSPDGSALAYAAESPGAGDVDLVVSDLRTGAVRRVTAGGTNTLPDWSPDGRRFVYTRCEAPLAAGNDYSCGIWVIGADGTGPEQLTSGAPGVITDTPAEPAANRDVHPVWSPDGRMIAFTRVRGETAQTYVMNADGSDPRPLLTRPSTADDWAPAWSHDGTRIAFFRLPATCCTTAANSAAAQPGIYLATADGADTTRLTAPTGSYEDFGPAFIAAAADPPPAEPSAPGAEGSVPAPVEAAPQVAIAASRVRMSRRGDVAILLRCLTARVCRGRLELRQGERTVAGRAFAIARELPVRLRLRLPHRDRRAAAVRGRVRLTARAGAASRTIVVVRGWKRGRG